MILEFHYCITKQIFHQHKNNCTAETGEIIRAAKIGSPQCYHIDDGFQVFFQTKNKALEVFLEENTEIGEETFLWIQLLQPIVTQAEIQYLNVLMILSESWIKANVLPNATIDSIEFSNWINSKAEAIMLLRFKLEQSVRDFQAKYTHEILKKLYIQQWSLKLIQVIFHELVHSESMLANNIKYEDVKKIRDIRNCILKNISKDLPSISELANQTNMSSSKFKQIFKIIYQDSPHQYFLNHRVEMAKAMLETNQYTISQVAYKTGFNHPSSLTRLFQNKYKVTPKKYFDLQEMDV